MQQLNNPNLIEQAPYLLMLITIITNNVILCLYQHVIPSEIKYNSSPMTLNQGKGWALDLGLAHN